MSGGFVALGAVEDDDELEIDLEEGQTDVQLRERPSFEAEPPAHGADGADGADIPPTGYEPAGPTGGAAALQLTI